MTSAGTYVCTLCNQAFDVETGQPVRCPHCLRVTGIVDASAPRSAPALLWPRALRWLAVLAALAVVAAAAWLALRKLSAPAPFDPADELARLAGVTPPWDGFSQVGAPFARSVEGQETGTAFAALAGVLGGKGFTPYSGSEPPDQVATALQLEAAGTVSVTPLEGVAYLLSCARAAGIPAVPCGLRSEQRSLTVPFFKRGYAACLVSEATVTAVVAPFSEAPPEDYSPLPPEQFAAHFYAAMAESARLSAEAYRDYSAALTFSRDPAVLFSRGQRRVRSNVVEFGLDDMRAALASGDDAGARLVVAQLLMSRGQPARALAEFEAAIALDPGLVPARLGKATALVWLGQEARALPLLEELLAKDPFKGLEVDPGTLGAAGLLQRMSDHLRGQQPGSEK
jgi:hypothetical protein